MERSRITTELSLHHEAFLRSIRALHADRLDVQPSGKWSPAQHLEHIRMSVQPVAMALIVPRWFLRWRFGTPNRPPRTYEALVARYKEKLEAGGKAPASFAPRALRATEVGPTSDVLMLSVNTLCQRSQRWSEADLDHYLLPHPLLGKVTVREMLFFTIYHVQHHTALVERDQVGSVLTNRI